MKKIIEPIKAFGERRPGLTSTICLVAVEILMQGDTKSSPPLVAFIGLVSFGACVFYFSKFVVRSWKNKKRLRMVLMPLLTLCVVATVFPTHEEAKTPAQAQAQVTPSPVKTAAVSADTGYQAGLKAGLAFCDTLHGRRIITPEELGQNVGPASKAQPDEDQQGDFGKGVYDALWKRRVNFDFAAKTLREMGYDPNEYGIYEGRTERWAEYDPREVF